MVAVRLNGFLPPDYEGSAAPLIDVTAPPAAEYVRTYPPLEIGDGRSLQASAATEAQFFAGHGFVLLPHTTAVRDWDRDVGPIYMAEVEAIIRERLLPHHHIEVQQFPRLTRRGRGTSTPYYAQGVHSDGPLTADAYALNVRAFASETAEGWWRKSYARKEVAGFMSIDFWRTTNMSEPLRHMPLALCEPNSIKRTDILPSPMLGIAPEGRTTHHLGLKFDPGQKWYFYPEVTGDELIAFKLNEFWKDDPEAVPQNVFHSAFADPGAPVDAEQRQSCEHRVGVVILRN